MAFPQVAAESSSNYTNTATPSVTLPSGIVSGSLVVAMVQQNTALSHTWPAGWNEIFDETDGSSASRLTIAYRHCDGGEGASVTVTIDSGLGSEDGRFRCFRFTGHHASAAPEVSAAAKSPASSDTAPDPANLTPSWGSADTLWLALVGYDDGANSRTITAYPSNYDTGQFNQQGGTIGTAIGGARRELAAASENPGAFTLSAGESWVAVTLAIRPDDGSGGGHPAARRLWRHRPIEIGREGAAVM